MKKAKVISLNQLIPINYQSIDHEKIETVNARDVYEFLEVKRDFSNWIKRKIKNYDFIEGQDYVCYRPVYSKLGSGGHNIIEYYVTLDMAKELSMVGWPSLPLESLSQKQAVFCHQVGMMAGFKFESGINNTLSV